MKPVDRGHVAVARGVRYERMRLFRILLRASTLKREQAESVAGLRAVCDAQPLTSFFLIALHATRTLSQQLGLLALGLGLS